MPSCFDCQSAAPEADSDHTLIKVAGWRVAKERRADGSTLLAWEVARLTGPCRGASSEAMTEKVNISEKLGLFFGHWRLA